MLMIFFNFIIILYLIINLKIKKKQKLNIIMFDIKTLSIKFNTKRYYYNIIIIIMFIIFYIVLFRLMKIFAENKYIDLKDLMFLTKINISFNNILMLIFLIFLVLEIRNIITFFLKKSFLEISYLYQAHLETFSNFYPLIVRWQHVLWYNIMLKKTKYKFKKEIINFLHFFFKFIGITFLFFSFLFDLIFNNFILINFCFFLPYVSVYQTFYVLNQFFDQKIDLKFEYQIYNYLYLDFMHKNHLYNEYKSKQRKLSFDLYYNIQTNIKGNKPPAIDKITLINLKNYLVKLFS